MNQEIGSRIHLVIGELVGQLGASTCAPSPQRILDATHQMWKHKPCGGTTAASARLRCSTCVSVYFQRLLPDLKQWSLLEVEHRLSAAVADLVWVHRDGRIAIDELKSGQPDPATDVALIDQLTRLANSGTAQWPDRFAGVRFVPIGAPTRTAVMNVKNSKLVATRMLAGMKST